jgi:hypothetical protein
MLAACPRAGSVAVDFHSLKCMLNYGDSFKESMDYLKKVPHSRKAVLADPFGRWQAHPGGS